ncbi:MAG: hypothetical protein ACKVQW_07195 [Pyrinomonadaceae bacterium]
MAIPSGCTLKCFLEADRTASANAFCISVIVIRPKINGDYTTRYWTGLTHAVEGWWFSLNVYPRLLCVLCGLRVKVLSNPEEISRKDAENAKREWTGIQNDPLPDEGSMAFPLLLKTLNSNFNEI